MRVQWITPAAPSLHYLDGVEEEYFDITSGWIWQEARWAGKRSSGHQLRIFSLNDRILSDADVTVVACEETFATLRDLPPTGRLLLRCIGHPPPPGMIIPAWERLAVRLPRVDSICALGPAEAGGLEAWSRPLGFKGSIRSCPTGAEVPAGVRVGASERCGVAWLGRNVPGKRIRFLVEACAMAQVPLTLALVMIGPDTEMAELGEAAKCVPEFKLVTVGPRERMELLQSVRVVATASHADNQWIPGTEIRACGGVAIAERGSLINQFNGDGMLYHNGTVQDLARLLRQLHDDDFGFVSEARRQHDAFLAGGYSAEHVGEALWDWVKA